MIHFSGRIVNEVTLERTVSLFREQKIIIPAFEQQIQPKTIPDKIKTAKYFEMTSDDVKILGVRCSNLLKS